MRTYYAFKNKNNHHKQDPDYFVFMPRDKKSEKGKLVGKIYKNKNKKGNQYLTIIIFREDEDDYKKEESNLCDKEHLILDSQQEN